MSFTRPKSNAAPNALYPVRHAEGRPAPTLTLTLVLRPDPTPEVLSLAAVTESPPASTSLASRSARRSRVCVRIPAVGPAPQSDAARAPCAFHKGLCMRCTPVSMSGATDDTDKALVQAAPTFVEVWRGTAMQHRCWSVPVDYAMFSGAFVAAGLLASSVDTVRSWAAALRSRCSDGNSPTTARFCSPWVCVVLLARRTPHGPSRPCPVAGTAGH